MNMLCANCGLGRYTTVNAPYVVWLGSRSVVVPNAPAIMCDMCNELIYEPYFIHTLQMLMDDGAGLAEGSRNETPRAGTGHLADEHQYRRST